MVDLIYFCHGVMILEVFHLIIEKKLFKKLICEGIAKLNFDKNSKLIKKRLLIMLSHTNKIDIVFSFGYSTCIQS